MRRTTNVAASSLFWADCHYHFGERFSAIYRWSGQILFRIKTGSPGDQSIWVDLQPIAETNQRSRHSIVAPVSPLHRAGHYGQK
jgi:hypothetical protein